MNVLHQIGVPIDTRSKIPRASRKSPEMKPVFFLNLIKIGIFQDEWYKTDFLCKLINEFKITHVFSVSPETELKKLYNDTIINWTIYLDMILYAACNRICPFCKEISGECENCKIDLDICGFNGRDGYFLDVFTSESILHDKVRTMIIKLKKKRDQL